MSGVEDEIPEGYKRTEVGVVPNDWVVHAIQDISKTGSGTTPARAQSERYFTGGKIYWVKTTDLNNSGIHVTEDKVTDLALKETCLQVYPVGTVLVAMYGGFNQIGRTGILLISAAVNQALVAIRVNKKNESRYLLYTLNYRVDYWKSVASSSRKDPNITSSDVKNYKLILPPTRLEQTAIANALTDVDALITSLEKLIAKKRAIKTAAMQQLLTGKKRLPPFDTLNSKEGKPAYKQTELGEIPEDWEVNQLSSVCLMKSGESITSADIDDSSKYPCYGGNGLRGYIGRSTHDGKYALIGRQGALCGNVLGVKGALFASEHAIVVTPTKQTNIDWLTYVLRRMNLNQYSESSAQPGLSVSKLLLFRIALPEIEEQTLIAKVLSDMDKEIEALEARLNKTQQIKQGMMQELLTGKTRLI